MNEQCTNCVFCKTLEIFKRQPELVINGAKTSANLKVTENIFETTKCCVARFQQSILDKHFMDDNPISEVRGIDKCELYREKGDL